MEVSVLRQELLEKEENSVASERSADEHSAAKQNAG
jgi:hypothetical protein